MHLILFLSNHRFSNSHFCQVQRMEASKENLRFYVYTEWKRGVAAKDVVQQLREAYGDAAPSAPFVYKWHRQFGSGERTSIQELPRSGRPLSQRNQSNISRVFDFVEAEPKSSLRCIAASLSLSKDTVRRILVDELLFRNVCSVWVPHKLSLENKKQRVECCQSFLRLFDDYSEYELMRLWATEDESWIPFELTGSKQDNKVWIPPETPRPTVVRPQLTFKKTMLSLVFTGNGKIWADATEKSETVDSERYVQFVHAAGEHWRKLRSDPTCLSELLWQHDNARPHTAAATAVFFSERKVELIKQAPYSPDLNQCDRWMFKLLKSQLKKRELTCSEDVRTAVVELFRAIPDKRFHDELENLRNHCLAVVAHHGDYITNH